MIKCNFQENELKLIIKYLKILKKESQGYEKSIDNFLKQIEFFNNNIENQDLILSHHEYKQY